MWQALIKRRKSVLDNKSIVIDKIKYMESQGKIKIDFKNKGETNDQFSGIFSEPADPLFYESLKALKSSVQVILDLPDDMATRIVPYAVSYTYGAEGRMGAVISSRFIIPSTGKETTISTPLMKCYEGGKDEAKCFSQGTAKKLWQLEAEARRYLAGDRAQQNLFDEEQPEAEQEHHAELPQAQPAIEP